MLIMLDFKATFRKVSLPSTRVLRRKQPERNRYELVQFRPISNPGCSRANGISPFAYGFVSLHAGLPSDNNHGIFCCDAPAGPASRNPYLSIKFRPKSRKTDTSQGTCVEGHDEANQRVKRHLLDARNGGLDMMMSNGPSPSPTSRCFGPGGDKMSATRLVLPHIKSSRIS